MEHDFCLENSRYTVYVHPLDEHTQLAIKHIGYPGRMISGSKSAYWRANPNNLVIFNAVICLEDGSRIWCGDLDLSEDEPLVAGFAQSLGKDILVLYESDGRWEEVPHLHRAVIRFDSEGVAHILEKGFARDDTGRVMKGVE